MRKLQVFYGIATVLIIVLGVVGCNLLDKDMTVPSSPASSVSGVSPLESGQLSNFYVGQGLTDFYGVYVAGTSLVVNVPKTGVYLLTYSVKAGFGINQTVLDHLEEKGVPDDILESLALLKHQVFKTQEEFLDAIAEQIGEEDAAMYEDNILRYAYAATSGPFYIVVKVKKNSLLYVGLQPGHELMNATIDVGDTTDLALTTPDAQDFGSVLVFFRPGFLGSWADYFIVNPVLPQISLVSNGAIVISQYVIQLDIPTGVTPHSQRHTKPKS